MPPETKQTPLERIAELEQQLALADEGVSKLARRCLALEQELQDYLSKHARHDNDANPALLQPKLFYDRGTGFSEQDSLSAPLSAYQPSTRSVSAVFELPCEARALRLDPGELPCYVTGLTLSDDELTPCPQNGIQLEEGRTLFARSDPNYRLESESRLPAGTKIIVSYNYYPLIQSADEPLFDAMLRAIEQTEKKEADARADAAGQAQQAARQAQEIQQLSRLLAEARQQTEAYRVSLEQMQASTCWRLTAPVRGILRIIRG